LLIASKCLANGKINANNVAYFVFSF